MLRYSIKKYREDPTMTDDDETCVYTRVFVQGYLMTRLGPMCRIQFSTERAEKKIRWTQTRRLRTGSLVALSSAKDNFRTLCMPAIIADHDIRNSLVPPNIQIFWANTDDAILDPTMELVMLESRSGYFEAVRHCMVGLQHVAGTATPLDKYLVSLDKSDSVAQHIHEDPEMNVGSLIHHLPESSTLQPDVVHQRLAELRESLRRYHIIDGINDQISPYTNLDNSQLSAVYRILTRELSIIQGPPGTGKTFTSVQALQILLDSQRQRGRNVILVAAQTNHAVDQILLQLINLGFQTVRLGGRTQNEDIKRYNMYNLRCRVMPSLAQAADRDYRTVEAARKRITTRIEEIVASLFSEDELIDPQALQAADIITQEQLESLRTDDGWSHALFTDLSPADTPSDTPLGLISKWLGDQRIEAPSIDARDPDFDIQEIDDMADFDAEDYDLDPDDYIADGDEKCDKVRGRWVPIKYRWTGANPRQYTEADLVIRKELQRGNLWDISKPYRGAVYQYWQRELVRLQLTKFRDELAANTRICMNLKANKWHRDLRCIRKAEIEIIGCTTTGLCKYRGLLAALKPRIMLIEEAAETKEASILSALYPSLQQLILVGDHQQIAPSCDTPFLDEPPYYIRVSMFERLVKMNMPYTMLNMQRRMDPSLREVLSPFYPRLQDHPVVKESGARPPIPGMPCRSFFFHHTWEEGMDDNLSKFNILEAEMIVHFINYLQMNGVNETEITVLTFYRGQRKKLLAEFRKLKHRQSFKNVQTVDSYQGEENDIVILSLVRSRGPNGPHVAGFLQDSNRGVVAISRARRGFYIFGNMINLLHACEASRAMWGQIYEVFHRQNRFGYDGKLPITCQQHGRTTWVSHPDEWINHHGGCAEPCQEKLECGHNCGRRCHWVQHSRLICLQPCERVLNCGHHCQNSCGEACNCACAAFTGAYPNDESWDDDIGADASEQVLRGYDAPFIGRDGPIGRIRGAAHDRLYGRCGGATRGNRLEQTSRRTGARNLFVRSSMLGQSWANFDARQHDAQQRQEYGQFAAPESFDPINPLAGDQNPIDGINNVRETFRQVTLNPRGRRKAKENVISVNGGMPSLERAWNGQIGNGLVPEQGQHTQDLLDLSNTLWAGDPMRLNQTQSGSIGEVGVGDSEGFATLDRHLSFGDSRHHLSEKGNSHMASGQSLPPVVGYSFNDTEDANWTPPADDRAEWENSSTTCEVQSSNSVSRNMNEESEEMLIDL
ncbi:putative ATP binding protein [Rosellinia necatrix]|uniref:Putative ATP binding protein n=1 Tax=Rosellinia necatrix TaxID=77044 RepID=A0A1W2TF80_ROSNE|nr:putative ATP binding protein [Rosellinia necatrix]